MPGGVHFHMPWGIHFYMPWGIHFYMPRGIRFYMPRGIHFQLFDFEMYLHSNIIAFVCANEIVCIFRNTRQISFDSCCR